MAPDMMKRWYDTMKGVGAIMPIPYKLFLDIVTRYSAADRHYHNLDHLRTGFVLWDEVKCLMENPDVVALAWFYHDIIMLHDGIPASSENASLEYATEQLKDYVPDWVLGKVRRLILATTHLHKFDDDKRFIQDMDLYSMSTKEDDFLDNSKKIRAEYIHVDDVSFNRERRRILLRFMDNGVYSTPIVKAAYEFSALLNLLQEIKRMDDEDKTRVRE